MKYFIYLSFTTILLLLILIALTPSVANAKGLYIAASTDYKLNETSSFITDDGQSFEADYGPKIANTFSLGYTIIPQNNLEIDIRYLHYSHISAGKPFNNKPEIFHNLIGLQIKYYIGK